MSTRGARVAFNRVCQLPLPTRESAMTRVRALTARNNRPYVDVGRRSRQDHPGRTGTPGGPGGRARPTHGRERTIPTSPLLTGLQGERGRITEVSSGGGPGRARRDRRAGRAQVPEQRKTTGRPRPFRPEATGPDGLIRSVPVVRGSGVAIADMCAACASPSTPGRDLTFRAWSMTPRRGRRPKSPLQRICTANAQAGHRARSFCTTPRRRARLWDRSVHFAVRAPDAHPSGAPPWCEEVGDKWWALLHRSTLA